MFSPLLSYGEGSAQGRNNQIPEGFAFPLSGLSKKGTTMSLLCSCSISYMKRGKIKLSLLGAGMLTQEQAGKISKSELLCYSLLPWDPWEPAKLEYDLQPSWRNDCWVHRAGILEDPVSLAGCLLFISAVRRMWLLEKGETCSCDTDTSQATNEAAALWD